MGLIALIGWFALTAAAQSLPVIPLDSFSPATRAQFIEAYAVARQRPLDAQAAGRLGMLLQAYEQHEAASQCYERARKLTPREPRWHYYFALTQSVSGKHDFALAALQTVLQLQSDFFPAQLKQAEALLALGRFAEAEKQYAALAQTHSDQPLVHFGLGKAKAAQFDPQAAIVHLRRSVELSPAFGLAHYALALAYRDLNQPDLAKAHLQLFQRNQLTRPALDDPWFAEVTKLNLSALEHFRQGVAAEAEGQFVEAEKAYRAALKVNPQLAQAYVNLIMLYGKQHRYTQLDAIVAAALAAVPNCAECAFNHAVALVELKRPAEAVTALRAALALNPLYAEAHFNLASLIEMQSQFDEALAHYRAALAAQPANRETRFRIGRLLVQQKDLRAAAEQLQQTLVPEDEQTPRYCYALASVYARLNDRDATLNYAQRARALALKYQQKELLAQIERDLKTLEEAK